MRESQPGAPKAPAEPEWGPEEVKGAVDGEALRVGWVYDSQALELGRNWAVLAALPPMLTNSVQVGRVGLYAPWDSRL